VADTVTRLIARIPLTAVVARCAFGRSGKIRAPASIARCKLTAL
jgi:hypothetical protein